MSLKPYSPRRAARDANYPDARRAVAERAHGLCEALWSDTVCLRAGSEAHHVEGRNVPDPHHPDRLLWVCAPCHRKAHQNPAEARRRGLMRSRLGTVTPSRWTA